MNVEKNKSSLFAGVSVKTRRKTYGISGLTEITVAIPVGKAWMNIQFTGGALTGYGVVPATFSTSNPDVQRLIELSPQFKEKRIKIVR